MGLHWEGKFTGRGIQCEGEHPAEGVDGRGEGREIGNLVYVDTLGWEYCGRGEGGDKSGNLQWEGNMMAGEIEWQGECTGRGFPMGEEIQWERNRL